MEDSTTIEFVDVKRAVNKVGQSFEIICGHIKGKRKSGEATDERPFLYLVKEDEAYIGEPKFNAGDSVSRMREFALTHLFDKKELYWCPANVRCWPLADIPIEPLNVCFRGKAGIRGTRSIALIWSAIWGRADIVAGPGGHRKNLYRTACDRALAILGINPITLRFLFDMYVSAFRGKADMPFFQLHVSAFDPKRTSTAASKFLA